MPVMFLIGAAQHRTGTHRIHVPALDGEGKPAKGPDKGIKTVEFSNGRADVQDVGTARWLKEKGHAAEVEVPAYGLRQPGIGPVLAYDEAGNAAEIEAAKPTRAATTPNAGNGEKK